MVKAWTKIKTFWENVTQSLGKITGYTGTWSKPNQQILTTQCMTAKRLMAMNLKDADQLKGLWLQTFQETLSIEGAASRFSQFCSME